MVHVASPNSSPKRQPHHRNFLLVVTALLNHLTTRAARITGKSKAKVDDWKIELRSSKSPLAHPKKLLTNISNKAMSPFTHHHNKKKGKKKDAADGWGNGGVWQKEILMGGKCEPLNFSGVIYYDINGNPMSEAPLRSPRASPMPGYLTRARDQRR